MLRMWLAAVCSLMYSSSPISRLLSPRGDQLQDLRLARGQPARETAVGAGTPSSADLSEQSLHADLLGQAGGLAEQGLRAVAHPWRPVASRKRPYS